MSKRKKQNMGPPRKSSSPRGRTPTQGQGSYAVINELRSKLDDGTISQAQFRRLIHLEDMRNDWAVRVQLRSIARDLLPQAASQARNGRGRLLAVLANVLLKSEVSELKDRHQMMNAETTTEAQQRQLQMLHDWSPYLAELIAQRQERRRQAEREDAEKAAEQFRQFMVPCEPPPNEEPRT